MKLILCLLVASSLPSFARLGETEQQCASGGRYGVPLESDTASGRAAQDAFNPVGLNIVVTFLDNKSVSEVYTKPDKSNFSRKEVDRLLAKNADSHGWTGPVEHDGGQLWVGRNNRTGFWNRGDTVTVKAEGADLALKILSDAGILKPVIFP
jgi:hypothetical protein